MVQRPHLRVILSPCSPGLCGDVLSCLICPRDSEVELVQGGERVWREVWRVEGTTLSLLPPSPPLARLSGKQSRCCMLKMEPRWVSTTHSAVWKASSCGKLSREPRQPHNSPHPDWRPALQRQFEEKREKKSKFVEGFEKSMGGGCTAKRAEVKERNIEINLGWKVE